MGRGAGVLHRRPRARRVARGAVRPRRGPALARRDRRDDPAPGTRLRRLPPPAGSGPGGDRRHEPLLPPARRPRERRGVARLARPRGAPGGALRPRAPARLGRPAARLRPGGDEPAGGRGAGARRRGGRAPVGRRRPRALRAERGRRHAGRVRPHRGGLRPARRGHGRGAGGRGPAPRHGRLHQLHDDHQLRPGRPAAARGAVGPRRRRLRPPLRLASRLLDLPPALRGRPLRHRRLGRGRDPARGGDPGVPQGRARAVRRGARQARRASPRPGHGSRRRRACWPASRTGRHRRPRWRASTSRAASPLGPPRSSGAGCARSGIPASRARPSSSSSPRPRSPWARRAAPGPGHGGLPRRGRRRAAS